MTEIEVHQGNAPAPVSYGSVGGNLIREAAAVMADAHALATAICRTSMVPKHFQGKPDDIAAAMLYGSSLGLDPMQAVRAIYIVHGAPGLYAKSMAGLAAAAGHETWTTESTDESVTVCGRRKGMGHVECSTWTIERAIKAGYVPTIDPETGKYRVNQWGKMIGNEKYFTDPQAMLHAKALAEVCRKIAPDVLAGVYAVEELQSERITVEQVQPTRGLAAALQTSAPGASGIGSESDDASAAPPTGPAHPGAEPTDVTDAELIEDEPITKRTRGELFALFGQKGIAEDDQLSGVNHLTGKQYASRSEITEADALKVIKVLRTRPDVDADA